MHFTNLYTECETSCFKVDVLCEGQRNLVRFESYMGTSSQHETLFAVIGFIIAARITSDMMMVYDRAKLKLANFVTRKLDMICV
jgi:hypothetical protein